MSDPTLTEAQNLVRAWELAASAWEKRYDQCAAERDQARAEAVAATTRYDDLRHRIEALAERGRHEHITAAYLLQALEATR